MRVTINDIAREAGVSKTTVSLYLNRHRLSEHMAVATKRRIDEVIAALGYEPSATARALSRGKTQTLGLVVGGIANEYFSHFAEAALEESLHNGYQLLVSLTRWKPDEEVRCLENLINRQADGILYYPNLRTDTTIARKLSESGYPLLLIEQESELFPTVRNQLEPALQKAVAELISRGHRHIFGVFGNFTEWPNAYASACGAHHLKTEQLQMPLSCRGERLAAVKEICCIRPPALIVNGRLTTEILIREITNQCPEYHPDIIMNYDFHSDIVNHELITGVIYCHPRQLVKTAVSTLVGMMEKNNSSTQHVYVPVEFIARNDFAMRLDEAHDNQWQ